MKLRDLVANSLPRVRGRKKKAAVTAGASSAESPGGLEVRSGSAGLETPVSRQPMTSSRSGSRDDNLELQVMAEANWRGNALYRGLEAARAVRFNSQMMSTSYTSSHGMVTSHSAEGFSSQMMMMSRSYDSRMTVPDCNESCPQMSSISEARIEPFTSPQQHYHCHYHRHDHHHYHHHHLHSKPMTHLAQNQQQQQQPFPHPGDAKTTGSHKVQEEVKDEPGFFRKSLASLGGIRRHSNKSKKDTKQSGDDKVLCSVCPYPETGATERKSGDKRPAKPKRKSLKAFSKLKENKETVIFGDTTWFSDNEVAGYAGGAAPAKEDRAGLLFAALDKPSIRERSAESCSSRLFGSREGSSVREVDLTGFDSASLSGYESDLPRSKVHRSRSRIKTNPWLPSPQPPVLARGQHCDLHESREDVSVAEEFTARIPRSVSFEYQRKVTIPSQTSAQSPSDQDRSLNQRPRSLTPSDTPVTLSLIPQVKSLSGDVTPSWWGPVSDCADPRGLRDKVSSKLNNLNTDVPKSRPNSTVSPNSEFVMLADNLEQLATNISFEYEEMLDSTLESVSICQEDGQASIQELLTDEENGNVAKSFLKSDGDVHSAHSPDSGIGGLGSTDGDDAPTPTAQREQSAMSVACFPASSSMAAADNVSETDPNLEQYTPNKLADPQRNKPSSSSKSLPATVSDYIGSIEVRTSSGYKTPIDSTTTTGVHNGRSDLETDNSATFSESDVDNTSYQDSGGFLEINTRSFHDNATNSFHRNPNKSLHDNPNRSFNDNPSRSFNDNPSRSFNDNPNKSFHDNRSFQDNPNRSFQDNPNRSFQDNPNRSFQDNPNRSFQDNPNRSFQDNPNRSFQQINNIHFESNKVCATSRGGNAFRCQHEDLLSDDNKLHPAQSRKPATLMVDERLDIQVAPCHRQILGSGIIMGSVAAKHEGMFAGISQQSSGKVCGSSALVCPRNLRPSTFRSSQQVAGRMNDMEKGSGQAQPTRPWSSEYDFPRNITECVESPTENWRCDEQFPGGDSQQEATTNHSGDHSSPWQDGLANEGVADGSPVCLGSEELVVKLHDLVTARVSPINKNQVPEIVSREEFSGDKLENGTENSFQMNDACVQTDFDDDFSKWDDAETLESLEERALDPAESTRLWLLAGNMQGSADTGYSSLTRDSMIFMDEDSLLVAGELEERAAAERLSFGESSKQEDSGIRTPAGNTSLKVDSHLMAVCADRHDSSLKEGGDAIAKGGQLIFSEDKIWRPAFSELEHVLPERNVNPFSSTEKITNATSAEKVTNPTATSPDYAILKTFSGAGSSVRTHQPVHDGSTSYSSPTTRSSSDSSDRTLKSSDSDDLDCGAHNVTAVKVTKTKDSETGETKVCVRPNPSLATSIDYRNPPSRYSLKKATIPQCQGQGKAWITEAQADGCLGYGRPKPETLPSLSGRTRCSSVDLSHPNQMLAPGCERADYLEFLKDAPLNRSHLKRPLFLVPGLGPVDMSCSEQVTLFSDPGTSFLKSRLPCSPTLCAPLALSTSPSTSHCGKKLKFKKGDHVICADNARSTTHPGGEHHSMSVTSSLSHAHASHHGRPNQPALHSLSFEHIQSVESALTSCDRPTDGTVPLHLIQCGDFKSASSPQTSQHLSSSSQQSPSAVTPTAGQTRASDEKKRKDEVTRSLRDRVMSLRREKDLVFQKIQEARQDDRLRQEQRLQIQDHMHTQRKEALLETLHELKSKLEEQSKLLKMREGPNT